MAKTNIEWCDLTLNPIVGCSKCSPGCDRCYAEKFAIRLAKNSNPKIAAKYSGVVDENGWSGRISKLDLSCFDKLPKKPSRIFVGSMTDLFHENVFAHLGSVSDIFDAMLKYPQHTFLLLTKRPAKMKLFIDGNIMERYKTPPSNVWLGVTVCNQEEADEKLPILMETPAAKRFVSVEPMLGPINLKKYLISCNGCGNQSSRAICLNRPGSSHDLCNACDKPNPEGPRLDWVICGAETGPKARPMDLQWARDLRDQCQKAGIPFFFKKAGNKKPIPDDLMIREFPE